MIREVPRDRHWPVIAIIRYSWDKVAREFTIDYLELPNGRVPAWRVSYSDWGL
jgi:hypothetical protein